MVKKYKMRAMAQVYDEVKASIPVEAAVDYSEELVEVMSITPPGYPVGMMVELSIGRTWGSVEEVGSTTRSAITAALEKAIQE